MSRPRGLPKTGGRQPGTPNKTTASVKAALEECFEKLGGVEALAEWAAANREEFYKLWAKILPKELQVDSTVEHRMTLEELVSGTSYNHHHEEDDYVHKG